MIESGFPHRFSATDLLSRYQELFRRTDCDVAFEAVIRRLYENILAPGMDGIDGGANVGGHTIPMAKLVAPNGHVFAFEPIAQLAERNRERVQALGLSAVVSVYELALADFEGESPFILATNRRGLMGMSGLRERFYPNRAEMTLTETRVSITTLDRIVPVSANISFIKLDLEGGELHALQGATRILKRDRPIIVFENCREGTAVKYGYDANTFFGFFLEYRYKLMDILGAEFRPDLWNGIKLPWYFIALPAERALNNIEAALTRAVAEIFPEIPAAN
jgi:FkbM family methyltransferase